MVKALSSNAGDTGLIPGGEAKISHASRPKNQIIEQKQHCDKFDKGFKKGPCEKKIFFKIVTSDISEW